MRTYWLLGLAVLLAGCGKEEAVFQGKPTSSWVKQLKSADAAARQEAAKALGNLGAEGVFGLAVALRDESPDVRMAAADSLSNIGTEAKPALPALTAALKDPEKTVRTRAAFALGNVAPEDVSVVPSLIDLLQDTDLEVRRHAALALGRLGPGAKPALEALQEASKDPDSQFRLLVRDAIRKIHMEISPSEGIGTLPPPPKQNNGT